MRPSKYNPAFCEAVIAAGKEGKTKAEMAAEIDVDRETLNNWMDRYPEFSRAVKRGLDYAQAWWEGKGREATFKNEGFNATSYIFNMKNRFSDDWRDKVESDVNARMHISGVEMTFVGSNPKAEDR